MNKTRLLDVQSIMLLAMKHGGGTTSENLAYACVFCNRSKGSDIGSIIWRTREFTRFYNPRSDRWSDHFRLQNATIDSKTDIGEVTARILGFNDADRLLERQLLIVRGKYPHSLALNRMNG